MARQTNRTTTIFTASALICLSGLAAGANAQFAPPPPAPTPAGDSYEPPAPPPTMTIDGRAEQAEQAAARREQLKQAQPNTPSKAPNVRRGIPNITPPVIPGVPTLLQKGSDGKLINWNMPLDLIGLKYNALVGENRRDAIEPVVRARVLRVERRLIDNIDLFRQVQAGNMNTDSISLDQLAGLTKVIEPLGEPNNLSTELYNEGALTAMQAAYNAKMVRDYKAEETTAIRLAEGTNQIRALWDFVVKDTLREPEFVHQLLSAEAMTRIDAVLVKAQINAPEHEATLRQIAGDAAAGTERDRLRKLYGVFIKLDDAQHERFLQSVVDTRADTSISEKLVIEIQTSEQRSTTTEPVELSVKGEDWKTMEEIQKEHGDLEDQPEHEN